MPERPHPVINQSYMHTFSYLGRQRLEKLPSCRVSLENVALEMNGPSGSSDGIEPSPVIFGAIFKQPYPVADR